MLKRREKINGTADVDLAAIERELGIPQLPVPKDLDDFAPKRPAQDIERAVRTIASFGELPTQSIDDVLLVAEEELARIKALAQKVRDAYVQVTDDLMAQIEHQRAIQKLAAEAFEELAQKSMAVRPELPKVEDTVS